MDRREEDCLLVCQKETDQERKGTITKEYKKEKRKKMLNEFLIDEKLKREEQRISKMLESICLKSNIKFDADGYPIPPPPSSASGKMKGTTSAPMTPDTSQKLVETMSSSNQMEQSSPLRISAFSRDENINQFEGGAETMGSRATSFNFQQNTSNKAYEQDFVDLQNELYDAQQALNDTTEQIEDLERTVLQLFQWKTSFSNFLLMVFYQYEQKIQKLMAESNSFGLADDNAAEMKSMDGSENASTIKSDLFSGEKIAEEFQNMIALIKSELFRNTIKKPAKKSANSNSRSAQSQQQQAGKDMVLIPVPKCVEQIVAKKGQSYVLGQLLLPESSNEGFTLNTNTVTTTSCLIDFQPLITICLQCQTRVLKQQLAAPAPPVLSSGKPMPNITQVALLPTSGPAIANHAPRIHSPITGYVLPVASYHVHHDYYTLTADYEELLFHVFVIFVTATTGLSPVTVPPTPQHYSTTGSTGVPSSGSSVASMNTTGTRQTMRGGMSVSGKFGGNNAGGSSGASVATGRMSRATTGAGTRANSKDPNAAMKLGKEEIKWYMNRRNFLLFIWLFELCDNRYDYYFL